MKKQETTNSVCQGLGAEEEEEEEEAVAIATEENKIRDRRR